LIRLCLAFVLLALVGLAQPVATHAQDTCGPTVIVAPGDSLFRIAQRCGTTVAAIQALNPQVTDPTRLFVGTVLTIQPPQPLTPATIAIFPAGGAPGTTVSVLANGLPANAQVTVGFGPIGAAPIITSGATSGAFGELQTQTNVAPGVLPGSAPWVITLTVGGQAAGTSLPFTITNPNPLPATPAPTPGVTLFDNANIYLVAIGDNGASGPVIGCQDSLIPVTTQFAPTVAPMTAAYQNLLSLKTAYFGESGLYNALYQSNLTLQAINIQNRQALVYLSGNVVSSGVCDAPRIHAQLRQVALQYSTVDSVAVFINNVPMENVVQ
jgi:LysM repeat protein